MSEGKKGAVTEREIRAHVLKKLKEALPQVREAAAKRREKNAGGQ